MNNELLEALTILEQEKNISKETLLEAIENSLITACKNHFGKSENVKVVIDPKTCEYHCFQEKTVVEEVLDPVEEISLPNAQMIDTKYELGDIVQVEVKSRDFGRIATQNAKNVILQKIREEERRVIYDEYNSKEKDVVTGVVQRYVGRNISINLGKADALLTESEQIRGEHFNPTERIKVYILEVKATSKGPKILVSRTHPELVKRLFESEVTEVREGIVEIKAISREAGSRTKIAVWSNDPDVDPVGACVGMNGARVNAIVDELGGEKIDIVIWDENPAILIQNALSPAKVISVIADADEKAAKVVVPDYQLSLAIGKEGQNARLAARLTGFKIDIKSETQARESGDFLDYENEYEDEDEDEYYGEFMDGEYSSEEYEDYDADADEENADGTIGDADRGFDEDGNAGDGAWNGDGEYADASDEDWNGDGEYADAGDEDWNGDRDADVSEERWNRDADVRDEAWNGDGNAEDEAWNGDGEYEDAEYGGDGDFGKGSDSGAGWDADGNDAGEPDSETDDIDDEDLDSETDDAASEEPDRGEGTESEDGGEEE